MFTAVSSQPQAVQVRLHRSRRVRSARQAVVVQASDAGASTATAGVSVDYRAYGEVSLQGTSRSENQDVTAINIGAVGGAMYGVYDGHGGQAVSAFLKDKLHRYVEREWNKGVGPQKAFEAAFLSADTKLLAPPSGLFGQFMERGVGGSKCGSTAVAAAIYPQGPETMMCVANVGDARAVLCRGGEAIQLTIDHVPDTESERNRIEMNNPNPKQPMVQFVGGTWRLGGLLALSRAFGDAYMKNTGDFEGVATDYNNDYQSGFGLTCLPDVVVQAVDPKDEYLIIASDGLNGNVERGGGGGLDNQTVCDMCTSNAGMDLNALAKMMAQKAMEAGSTDDVSIIILKLN